MVPFFTSEHNAKISVINNMNKIFIITLFLFAQLAMSQSLPSSNTSKKSIERLSPQLELEFKSKELIFGNPIFIRIFKQEAELEIWVKSEDRFTLFNKYPICTFGSEGLGPKLSEGDGKAPEGFYYVKANQLNPFSNYHLSFNLGYPNHYDRSQGRTGSALMVHGNCVSAGCYAMTDEKIEKIYTIAHAALENGQAFFRVHVFPFKLTDANLKLHAKSQWYEFWLNLKQGYDYFENNNHTVPNVLVKNKLYTFE
jgi:murein L,D-transpeptidase YafK